MSLLQFSSGWSVSVLVGLMMSTLSISYLISAPIWGFLLDRYLSQRWTSIIVVGGLLVIASALLMGPAPFLSFPKCHFTLRSSLMHDHTKKQEFVRNGHFLCSAWHCWCHSLHSRLQMVRECRQVSERANGKNMFKSIQKCTDCKDLTNNHRHFAA